MKPEKRSLYADYIASAIRYAHNETGLDWPDDTILIVHNTCALAELNEIIGLKIYTCNIPSSFEFFVALESDNECWKLQECFREYLELYPLD